MSFSTQLVRRSALSLVLAVGGLSTPVAFAQDAAASSQSAATRVPAKILSDKQCLMYGNVKPSFTSDGDQTVLRLEFGTGDGLFGGGWFPAKSATAGGAPCRGVSMMVRANGAKPGKAFLVVRTSEGAGYRSKDIASIFAGKDWHEVVLTTADFSIDWETKAEIKKTMAKEPDWTKIARMDISAVNLDASPTLEVKSIDYVIGGPALVSSADATDSKPSATPSSSAAVAPTSKGNVSAKNFSDNQCFSYGNVKPKFASDGGAPILRLEYGTGDGVFGGAWFPIAAPKIDSQECRGILLTARGNGSKPGRAYLFIKNAKGGAYRSKEINFAFVNQQWTDLLLTADDFIPDPDSKAEVTKSLPRRPDFSTIERLDFSAVNLDAAPVLEIKAIAFDTGSGATDAAKQDQAAPQATDKKGPPAGVVLQTNAGSDPLTPMPKKVDFPQGSWWERHEGFVARAKKGDVDLLWLGDSITDNWNKYKGTYNKLYPDLKAANFGIGGDGTQNLLWRLQNGELDGISPKVAVLLIGTNNVQWHESAQISSAIGQIVKTIRTKCPNTKVLLLAIFPRGDFDAKNPGLKRIDEVNAAIAKLDDGQSVRFLDIRSKLANSDGTIRQELFADKVHLSPEGFTVWADSMRPLLDQMMK